MTTTPTLVCAKDVAPAAGQEQGYVFFYLVPATDSNGNAVQVRQVVAKATATQLNTMVTQCQAKLALISALPA